MKKIVILGLLSGCLALLTFIIIESGLFSPIAHSPPIVSAITDARQLVILCHQYESESGNDKNLTRIYLDDALSLTSEGFRKDIHNRIDQGTIQFFPPSVPIQNDAIVAIVLWEDTLVTVTGRPWTQAYDKRPSPRTNQRR